MNGVPISISTLCKGAATSRRTLSGAARTTGWVKLHHIVAEK
jgi:hypothetical protein